MKSRLRCTVTVTASDGPGVTQTRPAGGASAQAGASGLT